VFIVGQAMGFLIYFRNLHFIRQEKIRGGDGGADAGEP
jgi:lipid-A-disaccharide synthase-like uncharacterized protein